jgi:hypothetical protein
VNVGSSVPKSQRFIGWNKGTHTRRITQMKTAICDADSLLFLGLERNDKVFKTGADCPYRSVSKI